VAGADGRGRDGIFWRWNPAVQGPRRARFFLIGRLGGREEVVLALGVLARPPGAGAKKMADRARARKPEGVRPNPEGKDLPAEAWSSPIRETGPLRDGFAAARAGGRPPSSCLFRRGMEPKSARKTIRQTAASGAGRFLEWAFCPGMDAFRAAGEKSAPRSCLSRRCSSPDNAENCEENGGKGFKLGRLSIAWLQAHQSAGKFEGRRDGRDCLWSA